MTMIFLAVNILYPIIDTNEMTSIINRKTDTEHNDFNISNTLKRAPDLY